MVALDRSADAAVVLVVPADAEFLHILRAVTAGVAAMLDIPYDTLDDQRIAVAEAANFLLGGSVGVMSLTLRLWPDADALVMSLEADTAATQSGQPDAATGFSWNIIQHLADSVERTDIGGRPGITMQWVTLPSPLA